ncbi:MAG: phosphoenolpyruvate carboxylase, partial [Planctomycetota bacterium]
MPAESDRDEALRTEIAQLGELLGQTVKDAAGEQSLQVVESIRCAARDRRGGDDDAEHRLQEKLANLDNVQLRVVIRAFSILLDLANLAEDRQRLRVLQQRERDDFPEPRRESIRRALLDMKAAGKTDHQIQNLVDALRIELVFTAHPTEAKRRSARHKLRRIRNLLDDLDQRRLPTDVDHGWQLIRAEMMKLWLTDFIRPWRPTVLQEVQRGLSIKPVLWDVAPQMLSELRSAITQSYEGRDFHVRPCLTFGSWIGGDRDGHPYVTA